tara:strand:+ start:1273 stop:1638 length:366 start_codon:yes stop_codon:yes gene_type:complete
MKESFNKLVEMQKLNRQKCPWGKIQDLDKYACYLKNELDELLEAIKNNDKENIKEEIGDLFLILTFMSAIVEEKYDLELKEIINGTIDKLEKRKPWVYGDMKLETPEEAAEMWRKLKNDFK